MIVTYKRKYPIGSFLNEDIGFEYEVPEGGNPIEAIQMLKEMADKAHELLNPGLSVQVDYSTIHGHPMSAEPEEKLSPEQQRQKAIDGHIQTISECKTLEHLNRFASLVGRTRDEKLTEAFENKLQSLQNQ